LKDHVRVEVTPESTTVERIEQRVMFVAKDKKRDLLLDILRGQAVTRAIVFARTKHGANRLAEQLAKSGVKAEAIHGNKSQGARQRALADFHSGRVTTLVATDIAARGIDVDGISHVINFDLPNEPESYVHRIGRTARAGADGIALSFCDADEIAYLKDIERTIRQPVPSDESHRYHSDAIARLRLAPASKPKGRQSSRPAGGNNHRGGARTGGARRAA
jgi:ATP-dependent RNA helicase RhlE